MYNRFRVAKLLSHKSLWKEWTSFTIQDVRRVLPRNFVHCFQRQFHIRLGYETLSFLFLEQCFQLSLSDEIGGTFFDIDNFSIIPKYIFFDINNLPIIWKMPIYRLSIIFFDNIAHPYPEVIVWVCQSLTLRTELTDVTLVSEDTYWRFYRWDSDD